MQYTQTLAAVTLCASVALFGTLGGCSADLAENPGDGTDTATDSLADTVEVSASPESFDDDDVDVPPYSECYKNHPNDCDYYQKCTSNNGPRYCKRRYPCAFYCTEADTVPPWTGHNYSVFHPGSGGSGGSGGHGHGGHGHGGH